MNTLKHFYMVLAALVCLPFAYLQANVVLDRKVASMESKSSAERMCFADKPIASMSYFGDSLDGYVVVTFKKTQDKKYLYRGVPKTLWDDLKDSQDVMKFYHEHLANNSGRKMLVAKN